MGMKGKIALGAVVGVAVIGAVSVNSADGGGGHQSDGDSSSSASAGRKPGKETDTDGRTAEERSAKERSAKAPDAEKKVAFRGDGSFEVGTDIKPGTYRTTGNTDGMCYWERAKNASGEVASLIANDNVSGTSYVTVKAGDKLFKSSGCKDWEAVDGRTGKTKSPAATRFEGDGGMYRVGFDIAPGTYRSTGNSDDLCYWERAKDALHSIYSIRANDNVTGTAVVTISAGDAYFKTTGCQDWKKTS
ncbi:hypothetical protein ACFVYF_11570 [Streptomyces sp. NPDC058274]|uniref:hypothetical protein n=1 Tax=Streptomyces sp. NPDC058274 TaxID=3346416 RepID=UPI0036EF8AF1